MTCPDSRRTASLLSEQLSAASRSNRELREENEALLARAERAEAHEREVLGRCTELLEEARVARREAGQWELVARWLARILHDAGVKPPPEPEARVG